MFEGLNWRAAARRSAIVIAIYLVFVYVLSVARPETFPIDVSIIPMVVIFFFVFTLVYAFVERNKNRRIEQAKKQQSSKPDRPEADLEAPGALRGRPNPNTSRKKTRRKR